MAEDLQRLDHPAGPGESRGKMPLRRADENRSTFF